MSEKIISEDLDSLDSEHKTKTKDDLRRNCKIEENGTLSPCAQSDELSSSAWSMNNASGGGFGADKRRIAKGLNINKLQDKNFRNIGRKDDLVIAT